MPKIQWTDLPPALRDHLFERLRERGISAEDLWGLKVWRESGPEAAAAIPALEKMRGTNAREALEKIRRK